MKAKIDIETAPDNCSALFLFGWVKKFLGFDKTREIKNL